MVDSNKNGIPDTGPIAAGATYNVVMKAVLPGNASGNNLGAGYTVTKLATSDFDSGTKDDAIDKLVTISGAGVDLTNNTVGGLGVGLNSGDNNGSRIVTNSTNPDTTTTFTLVVKNTGPNPDTFNLLADKDTTIGSVNDLPAGWTVVFKDAGGTVVSSTGVIASGLNKTFTATIFVPAGSLPATQDIFFQTKSPTTAAGDIVRDAVAVNTVRSISIQTDNVGQTFPGGAVVYEHLLTNNGNVTEGTNGGGGSTLTLTHIDNLSAGGFSSVIYYDADGNGALTATDPVLVSGLATVKPAGLAPGEQVRLFVKTFAPLGAADGAVNVTTVTVNTAGVINTIAAPAAVVNTDTTSVIRGDLAILKEQAIDKNGNGVIDGSEGPFVTTLLSAPPGSVIIYKITVTNSGSANATGITVNDSIPSNTTYFKTGADGVASITGGSVATVDTQPSNGATGAFLFNIGKLAPAESSVMKFGVKIDQ
jgi:uncharacterized repeat protein (TIGR01451 family)